MRAPALFLDRDGVINIDHGYVFRRDDFDFVDGIFDISREARGLGYKLVVVTNQAGIGRGYYTETDFESLTGWMRDVVAGENALIDGVYFSPYHPTKGMGSYLRDHYSRKPAPGMLLQAAEELDIELASSLLIGDKMTDLQAGLAAGLAINLLLGAADADAVLPERCYRIDRLGDARPFLAGLNTEGRAL